MKDQEIRREALRIVAMSMLVNAQGRGCLHCDISSAGVSVTWFNRQNILTRQEIVYEFEPAALPRLRKLRHDVEQMLRSADMEAAA